MEEQKKELDLLKQRISDLMVRLDIPGKEREIAELETEAGSPDFWLDPARAQALMHHLSSKKELVRKWRGLERDVADLLYLAEIGIREKDTTLEVEVAEETARLVSRLEKLETELLLSGEYDVKNAIVAIHAGAGGTESQDWAEMLLRMYLRWAERRGFRTEILDTSPGEEAGIKSAVLEVRGDYAYGYLKSEFGVHRLVRLSPFDADHARHTSFALVEVLPEAEGNIDLKVNPDDLKIEFYRSSGPGGQHMQKTSTAVRITHIPTGIIATCQSQRSQLQNKESAMKVLYARLLELERKRKEQELARLKGERIEAGWGNQIRSYVLHPYKLVKDHRTGYETGDAGAVLDGDLDGFIGAYLRSKVGEK
ncbi:MAG: peptide chain release factor 2 [Dehalococcoidia bacterium]|nr:peptide chain release factor 2 [Dehalococcoidia bacterium]